MRPPSFDEAVLTIGCLVREFAEKHGLKSTRRKSLGVGTSYLITPKQGGRRGFLVEVDFREQQVDAWIIESADLPLTAEFLYGKVKRRPLGVSIPSTNRPSGTSTLTEQRSDPHKNWCRTQERVKQTLDAMSTMIESLNL
jgi:hypothetical protein